MKDFQILFVRKLDAATSSPVENVVASLLQYCLLHNLVCAEYNEHNEYMYSIPTILVAIGGDGTVLYAARESTKFQNAAIIGCNTGRRGFLADSHTNEQLWEMLDVYRLMSDAAIHLDRRSTIEGTVDKSCTLCPSTFFTAMNEILILPALSLNVIEYTIDVNNKRMATQRSSGVMVSTPTGSTAFSLSVGGAILEPSANLMQIVSVAPLSLSARPIVIPAVHNRVDVAIEVTDRTGDINIVADGQIIETLSHKREHTIHITHGKNVDFLRPRGWNFFEVLVEKMGTA